MQYRPLGKTGIQVSAISFGAGPISTLMVGDDLDRQRMAVEHALRCGINWFDTAATYGGGRSEENLGRALASVGDSFRESLTGAIASVPTGSLTCSRSEQATLFHVATKVRLMPSDLGDIRGAVRRSFEASLQRLRLPTVTLLQLHNSITLRRGEEPTSVTPADVLGPGGIVEAFEELRDDGLVLHFGLTGIGDPSALRQVVRSGQFATMQVPYHLLNPSAGREMTNGFAETNYGNIIADCAEAGMGVLAIRVLAGGALVGNPPSPHTLKTPFFPLALYERDRRRAARLQDVLGPERSLQLEAIRFALAHRDVSAALIGFAEPWQIDEALAALESADLPLDWADVIAMAESGAESR